VTVPAVEFVSASNDHPSFIRVGRDMHPAPRLLLSDFEFHAAALVAAVGGIAGFGL